MLRKATGIAGALAAGAILASAVFAAGVNPFKSESAEASAPTQSAMINRTGKGDRQTAVANNNAPRKITTVEVVGVEDATIVYRDRDGHVLFKTDPLSNVTVVTKGVVLPEVTVRETADTEVKRMPMEGYRPTLSPTAPGTGCESSVTAHTGPANLARMPSRCVTTLPGHSAFASVN